MSTGNGYSSLQVAYTLLEHGPASHMKLQKLTFIAYSAHLYNGFLSKAETVSLLNEEPVCYKYGPIFPSMYRILKPHGKKEIVLPGSDEGAVSFSVPTSHRETREFLNDIYQQYGACTDLELSTMCHMKDSAWERFAHNRKYLVGENETIPENYIISGYRSLIKGHM